MRDQNQGPTEHDPKTADLHLIPRSWNWVQHWRPGRPENYNDGTMKVFSACILTDYFHGRLKDGFTSKIYKNSILDCQACIIK